MVHSVNDFVITVATANGSGSQSSNSILVRSLFAMGLPVGGKNLFPSNIQGLPTWYSIRVNASGFTARKAKADIVVAMNPASMSADISRLKSDGVFIFPAESKGRPEIPAGVESIEVPFRKIVDSVTDSVRLKKLLVNMVYVGVLAELLNIPQSILESVTKHQFKGKESIVDVNVRALLAGREYARQELSGVQFPYRAEIMQHAPTRSINDVLIDGNTAAAMGLLFGGCTVVAWYPITPSSSIVETFTELAESHRVAANGERNFAVVQAEDELASIAMVVGAGWAGARACTTTSGPGLSLMGEAAGLCYYAEIPAVIWDVQRVGPSTGLPTRTMQGDLLSAYYLSHGDTKHAVLIPGTPAECYEFGQLAFDLAERLQTLVIVLSDLDLGMNLHISPRFTYPEKPMDRGKVLNAEDLTKRGAFSRYLDSDGDGIPYRTLTGTAHPLAAYFTRGTGHDEAGNYSEDATVYQANMERLSRKFATAAQLAPKPKVHLTQAATVGLLYYGSTHEAIAEVQALLNNAGVLVNLLRLSALPFSAEVYEFIQQQKMVFVIEQNRDAQLLSILRAELPQVSSRCHSVLHCNGLPVEAAAVAEMILTHLHLAAPEVNT